MSIHKWLLRLDLGDPGSFFSFISCLYLKDKYEWSGKCTIHNKFNGKSKFVKTIRSLVDKAAVADLINKGYQTNIMLTMVKIIENDGHLCQIESAFRIFKTDLKIKPIFHCLQIWIETHNLHLIYGLQSIQGTGRTT